MIFVQKSNKQNGCDLFGEQRQNKTWTETAALSELATAKASGNTLDDVPHLSLRTLWIGRISGRERKKYKYRSVAQTFPLKPSGRQEERTHTISPALALQSCEAVRGYTGILQRQSWEILQWTLNCLLRPCVLRHCRAPLCAGLGGGGEREKAKTKEDHTERPNQNARNCQFLLSSE